MIMEWIRKRAGKNNREPGNRMTMFGSLKNRIKPAARILATICCTMIALAGYFPTDSKPPTFDVVIMNGRVIHPESKLDAVRNIGILNGKIQAISSGTMQGRATVDAKGLVDAPGFID